MHRRLIVTALAFAVLLPASQAWGQNGVCPPRAGGVPFWSPATPKWRDFGGPLPTAACTASDFDAATQITTDCHYDDPRWRGAAAMTYTSASGSANPPVQYRTLWANEGADKFLYMQWITRVGIFGVPGNNHDLFFAFERPGADAFPIDHKRGYMVKVHVAPNPTSGLRTSVPTFCDPDTAPGCDESTDYYSIYTLKQVDRAPNPGVDPPDIGPEKSGCTDFSGEGAMFRARNTGTAWLDGALQIQRECNGATCSLWTVSARVPVVAANAASVEAFDTGIEEASRMWYEVDLKAADLDAMLASWPRLTNPTSPDRPTCLAAASNQRYIQRDLINATGWAQLIYWDGFSARDPECFDGFALAPDDIGNLVRDFGSAAPSTTSMLPPNALGREFKAFTDVASTVRATNRVVARMVNNGAPRTNAKLKARFRLAHWGIQPWVNDNPGAAWTDIRGSNSDGVCAASGAPAPAGSTCGDIASVNTGDYVPVSFDWNIGGDDASVSVDEALEYCQFGLTPPTGFTCEDCSDPKETRIQGSPTGTCVRKLWDHQCMVVELGADSEENFETQSVYKNMNVRQMSETAREAMISVRGLPPIAGRKDEEVYLVLMPRNLPESLPGTTGIDFVQANAGVVRDRVLRPYEETAQRLPDGELRELADRGWGGFGYGRNRFDPVLGERPEQFPPADLPRGALLMPPGQRAVAEFLDGATRHETKTAEYTDQMLSSLDDVTATAILPTVDVYAFRRGTGKSLIPLSSFSLVVHHDGPMYGIEWEIDGARRISYNVFRVEMPVGHRKKINVRVMAKESPQDNQRAGNEKWPCTNTGGICCTRPCAMSEPDFAMGHGIPLLMVGVGIAVRPRRKRKEKPSAKEIGGT